MIFVTGATGFVGSELVRQLLSKGEAVRALKRRSSLLPAILKDQPGIEWVDGDLLDYYSLEDALDGVDNVYHCAAFVSFSPRDKKAMMKVNVEGTANLLNASTAKGVKKFLHVSSVAAVGDSKRGEAVTEKHHWEFGSGQSAYSVSKYESEMEVFRAHVEGLNTVIVNPSVIIGKNAGTEGSGQLFETVRKGLSFYPSGSCGFVDVEDVAAIMIVLMESDVSGQRFILNAENWTYRDFFSEVARNLNRKPPSIALKPWMLELTRYGAALAGLVTGRSFGITRDTVRSAFKQQNYSNDSVRKLTGREFKPLKYSIADACSNPANP